MSMDETLKFRRRVFIVLCLVAVVIMACYTAYILGYETGYMEAYHQFQPEYGTSD